MGKQQTGAITANHIKGGMAGIAILACIAWFIYLATSGGPTEIKSIADPATDAWMKAFATKQTDVYQQLERVTVRLSDDGKSISASGTVKSAADLAKLKATLEGIEPKTTIAWDVKVGP